MAAPTGAVGNGFIRSVGYGVAAGASPRPTGMKGENPGLAVASPGLSVHFDIQLGDDGGAALAQTVLVSFGGVHPAAGALLTLGLGDTDG